MSKDFKQHKDEKKKPTMTLKERRLRKHQKKDEKHFQNFPPTE